MKKNLAMVLAMLMVISAVPLAFADTEVSNTTDETDNTTIEEPKEEAGITPDSPIWGLERAIERIDLALTFNKAKKIEKRLAHARERLYEVQVMITEKKMTKAAKAQKAHKKTMEDVEEDIEDLGNGDAEGELTEMVKIGEEVKRQAAIVQKIQNAKLKMKGLTGEQQQALEEMTNSLDASNEKVQIEVMQKKDKVKIKLKATKEMSNEEVAALEEQVRASVSDGEVKIIGKGKVEKEENSDEGIKGKSEDKAKSGKNKEKLESDEDDSDENESDDEETNEVETNEDDSDDEESDDSNDDANDEKSNNKGNGKGKNK